MLFLVDSEHLEEVKTKVTDQQLKKNSDIFIAKLQVDHPELVVNMDETSLDSKQETDKLKVVSQHDCPRQYQSMRGDSHITFVPTVGVTGWTLPVLVILKSLTVVSDLAIRYGFPKSQWAHLVSSTSAYINEEIFEYWVTSILVPRVETRRRMLGLPEDAKALLILDGCLSHSKSKLEDLKDKFIDFHYLVPHSSNITESLDQGIFSYHKRIIKNMTCNDTFNKMGKCVMKGLIAMSQVCTPSHI